MTVFTDIQYGNNISIPFSEEDIKLWVHTALQPFQDQAELTLRFVDLQEMSHLNLTYRQKSGPTNVLSFPSDIPKHIAETLDEPFLGDVVISPDVLQEESDAQGIQLKAHWAHIIIHGVLHLLGYDHVEPQDEAIMQAIEIQLLNQLGYENPYLAH